jgi:hypothetical protein
MSSDTTTHGYIPLAAQVRLVFSAIDPELSRRVQGREGDSRSPGKLWLSPASVQSRHLSDETP